MKWSFKIFKIFGIEVRVHYIFILLLLAISIERSVSVGISQGVFHLILIILVFLCVLLHEMGHSLVAIKNGINVNNITLTPIGGIAQMEDIPEDPFTEIIMALSGPSVNIIITILIAPLFIYLFYFSNVVQVVKQLVLALLFINLIMAIFNLLPAFPMDGGRILRAVLALKLPYFTATRVAVIVGKVFAGCLGFLAILVGNYWLILIAIFIFFAGGAEERMLKLKRYFESMEEKKRAQFTFEPMEEISINFDDGNFFNELLKSEQDLFKQVEKIRRRILYEHFGKE